MKVLNTNISQLTGKLISVEYIDNPFLQCPFHSRPEYHAHPEIEILYIIKGSGTRIINGKLDRFCDGEMIFMGPNVPHIWLCDITEKAEPTRAILLYFEVAKFEKLFDSLPHFASISELIRTGTHGLEIKGETKKNIAERLWQLTAIEGFPQLDGILNILHVLSRSTEISFVCDMFETNTRLEESDRIVAVVKYINEHLDENISLQDLARIACLSPNAFCRFFKNSLKTNVFSFIQQQRIMRSCSLLVETDQSVAQIAEQCGYSSASHFTQIFRKKMNVTPLAYRKQVQDVVLE